MGINDDLLVEKNLEQEKITLDIIVQHLCCSIKAANKASSSGKDNSH
ncbi:hypothetical protein BVRB_6g147900 isoform B [Beta vulgaris subsp. vulgaris]|nr:hypothetical protein BVRB_6g147900 isoform B [Beta vulgaris subsp. vulgaris]